MKGANETKENPGLVHRTVRCATGHPGSYDFKLATFGIQKSRSAIIHRAVQCATGLSGAPAEQRLQRNGRLQRTPAKVLQCADSSRRSQSSRQRRTGQWTVPVRCGTGLSSAIRRPYNEKSKMIWWQEWPWFQQERYQRQAIEIKRK